MERTKNEVICRAIRRRKEKTRTKKGDRETVERENERRMVYCCQSLRKSVSKEGKGLINRWKFAGWSRRMRTEKRPLDVMRVKSVLLN